MNLGELELEKVCLSQIENIRLFVNTLTVEYTYFGRNMKILTQQVQKPLSLKQNTFSGFLLGFWNLHEMENIFKKKESLLA